MRICIVGTGYVGLVTGTCFAEKGNVVWCVDVDAAKVEKLNNGIIPIYEPGLEKMVQKNIGDGRLFFTTDIKAGLKNSLFCFICVGTPPNDSGAADLSQVFNVAADIGQYMQQYLIVVNKSTVPVGTAGKIKNIIQEKLIVRKAEIEFDVVSNPEFLKEGTAVNDFMHADRIVIGTDNVRTAKIMKQLYEPFVCNQNSVLTMDIKSAELTKYASNAMLAVRISFMNELAQLCDCIGADIVSVRKGVGTDRRIGFPFLYAGVGYGGSCFPKDIKELINTGRRNGVEMQIISAAEKVNNKQKRYIVEMVEKRFGKDLSDIRLGIWGLAFKPQTDDMREAPSIVIINELLKMGAEVSAFDPIAIEQARRVFGKHNNLKYADNMLDVLNDADALILITEWRQFRQPNFMEIKRRMRNLIIFDGRNQYEPNVMKKLGFEYYCIGRNSNGC